MEVQPTMDDVNTLLEVNQVAREQLFKIAALRELEAANKRIAELEKINTSHNIPEGTE